jgi:AcrR family transcriptional regulator
VPRDGAPTRQAILNAAISLLREGGLPGLSVERVATRAAVAKGLVLYHFGSRARLVEQCGHRVAQERADRLAAAVAGRSGIAAVDAHWEELTRQQDDGTARAWLSLVAAGVIPAGTEDDLVAQARGALLDGCAAALAAGSDRVGLREAYEALVLALLNTEAGG